MVGNITEDATKRYIEEQSEESRKEDRNGAAFHQLSGKNDCNTRLSRERHQSPYRAIFKPPLEVVIGEITKAWHLNE